MTQVRKTIFFAVKSQLYKSQYLLSIYLSLNLVDRVLENLKKKCNSFALRLENRFFKISKLSRNLSPLAIWWILYFIYFVKSWGYGRYLKVVSPNFWMNFYSNPYMYLHQMSNYQKISKHERMSARQCLTCHMLGHWQNIRLIAPQGTER